MRHNQRWLLFISSLGGILEFYDFIIYALFATYISKAFYPESHGNGLLITFATFAVGYLVRPLGGLVFGHFGDRYGRKVTFTISIFMMAIATLCIGFIPTYEQIGIAAPILITILRIAQGISIGGEIPGAIAYVSESIPHQKGMACGIIFCSLIMGIVFGSLIQAIVVSFFSEEQMQLFGFRIPFIIGGVFGLISTSLRREIRESAQFLAIEKQIERYPILTVFKNDLYHVVRGLFVVALCAAIITSLFLFIPSYLTNVLHVNAASYVWERTAAVALSAFLCLFFGALTDVIDINKLIFVVVFLTMICAYPIYYIYAYYPAWYNLAFFMSAILTGFSAGIVPSLLSELFKTQIRYSGVAVTYNIGFAIFGGLTPFISLSMINYTGMMTVPAFYLIFVALLAMLSGICFQLHSSVKN